MFGVLELKFFACVTSPTEIMRLKLNTCWFSGCKAKPSEGWSYR